MGTPVNLLGTIEISKLITHTIDAATDYLKSKEIEKTERQRIVACLNAISAKIHTERKKFENFMEKSFAERERLYKTFDKLIQRGLENNDIEMLKLASNCMLNIYNKSPLDGFKDISNDTQLSFLNQSVRNFLD
ncbi:hypothetical protein C0966_06765 [Bacillus methanolicus]|uniref:hypothetical protein n=1 Tax=Bacillus methanolicus TaxID=1471 RepID=UPI00238061F2|nr:hypothetical protein [Bacillus methanolicus]MDE3839070.1 hypothetical protein [Bacillus methanolicus]